MNGSVSWLLIGLLQAGGLSEPVLAQPIPRVEVEQCSGPLSFSFHLDHRWRCGFVRGRLYVNWPEQVRMESLDIHSLESRTEFLVGDFVDPGDPDDDLRVLVRWGNRGAAYDRFKDKSGYRHPPFEVSLKEQDLKWRYDTFKAKLDHLEQDIPPKYNLDAILKDIQAQPEELRAERRRMWERKLWPDATVTTGGGGGAEDLGMVWPDGRFMWRGRRPNFEEVYGLGNVLTRTMESHSLTQVGHPRKWLGLERIWPACIQVVSPDGRWGFMDEGPGSSKSLDFYDTKTMKRIWGKHRKYFTYGAAFSPDGRHCVVHGRGPIWIFDMEKQRLAQELWIELPEMAIVSQRVPGSTFANDSYAEFSPEGRYFVMMLDGGKDNRVGFYDLQTGRTVGAIPPAERAFRGWGPLEHTAFFVDSANRMVLRDIRDGERLLELAPPAPLNMEQQRVNRLVCPSNHEGMVLASLTNLKPPLPPGPFRPDALRQPAERVVRWNLKPRIEVLREKLSAKVLNK